MTRAELLRRRAELARESAAIDDELARLAERDEQRTPAAGYVDQSTSPLGKNGHLRACRAGLPHKAIGKRRLVRVEDVEAWLEQHDKPRRRRVAPAESGPQVADLADAFGVEPRIGNPLQPAGFTANREATSAKRQQQAAARRERSA